MHTKLSPKITVRPDRRIMVRRDAASYAGTSSTDTLLHELQVHQVELETQNEELRRTQLELAATRDRFIDLYDFAPVGYVTLDERGLMVEANLTAASMFGEERKTLLHQPFSGFVALTDSGHWQRFLAQALTRTEPMRMELTLQPKSGQVFHGQIDCLRVAAADAAPRLRITLTDITPRKQAEMDRRIAGAAIQAVEADKRRLSRQLHEELGQQLSALKMDLSCLHPSNDLSTQEQRVTLMAHLLDKSVATVRRMAADLRPLMLDDLGLNDAIEWLAHDWAKRLGLQVTLNLEPPSPLLSEEITTALYRMVQELLTEIARHGYAANVNIDMHQQGPELVLMVQSSGGGWPVHTRPDDDQTTGMLALNERAHLLRAQLELVATPDHGQKITVRLPITHALRSQS